MDKINVDALIEFCLWLASVLTVLTVAAFVIKTVRRKLNARAGSANEMFGNFREMHERGMLSDEEFRTIKTRMASRLRAELNRNDETV